MSLADPFLVGLSSELLEREVRIREHYELPYIFDHIVKMSYYGRSPSVLVVGGSSDSYYGVHICRILREECGIAAPLIDIHMLSRVFISTFDEILICYNRPQVESFVEQWARVENAPVVYLDDLISRHHWVFALAERVQRGYGLRDLVRGLVGQAVEETRSLQFDAWSAVARDIVARIGRARTLLVYGAGCGIAPKLFADAAEEIRVFEDDPVYLSNLALVREGCPLTVHPPQDYLDALERAGDGCVSVFVDAVNRAGDLQGVADKMNAARDFYLTSFLSAPSKPQQPALFRMFDSRNVAFGREDRRDMRCYGQMQSVWLPRENSLPAIVGGEYRVVFNNNEHFSDSQEYASGYVAVHVAR